MKAKSKIKISEEVREYFSKIGKLGGSSTSDAKRKASAENGRLYGGRPKGSKNKKKEDEPK